jgi:ribosomal protein S18 acetylase RimI-like enzyme
MSNFTLRSLYPEDIDQVANIESSLTGSPRRDLLEKRLAVATANLSAVFLDEIADMRTDLQSMPENFITCAALDGRKLAGYGFARILEGEFGTRKTVVELDDIGVDPDYQGKGVGKMVIAGIEQRMGKRNISTMRTQIAWSNLPMVSFFASAGFTLASGQIIERGTSPLSEDAAEAAALKTDGGEVGSDAGCECRANPASSVKVRPLKWEDLAAVDRIDAKLTGLDRSAYCAAKFREVLDESGVRVSLVAEQDGIVTGFIMARADFGEFGSAEKTAVIDTIGVHPSYGGRGIGHVLLSQLLIKLAGIQVDSVRTRVDQENFGLWSFLSKWGFKPSQRLLLTKEIR